MGTRYTKNIPKSVYFWKSGGYWAGPFVHPQKGRECVEYRLVPVTKGEEAITAFSPELNEKANALIEKGEKLKKEVSKLPISVVTNRSVSQEELDKLAEWLKSDEGKQKLKEAQEKVEKFNDVIEKMFDIDPKLLREPFTI